MAKFVIFKKPIFPSLTSGLLLSISPSFAGEGLRNLPASAQSQGNVGGNISLSHDPSVVRLNPASMLDIDTSEVQFTTTGLYGRTDYKSPGGTRQSIDREWIPMGTFHAVIRPEGYSKWAFGIGLNTPFGLASTWPREGSFQFTAPYDEELLYVTLNPAVAYQLSDSVSIGAGLDIAYSKVNFQQDFPWALATMVPGTPGGGAEFDGDGWGLGGYFGINVQLAPKHRFSLVGRLPVEVEYSGDYTVENIPGPLEGTFSPKSDFNTDITFPGSIAFAYRYDVNERVRLGFQYEWIQSSTHDDIPISVGVNQALYVGNESLILDWQDSFSVGLGIEWDATDRLTLRAGYLFSESPVKENTFTPAISSSDRNMFSVGGTYHLNDRSSVSLSYIQGFFDDAEIEKNRQAAFLGDYKINWQAISASMIYRW
ncbi:MAG: long-chain fatty acid transport protein [Akkermansiaceae bacterium]|jgi:long-chain fatty acid transport protein